MGCSNKYHKILQPVILKDNNTGSSKTFNITVKHFRSKKSYLGALLFELQRVIVKGLTTERSKGSYQRQVLTGEYLEQVAKVVAGVE